MRRPIVVILILSALIFLKWRADVVSYFGVMFPPQEYVVACKAAKVRFLRSPRTPITSVALDYQPPSASEAWRRYEVGFGGRVDKVGSVFWQRVEKQINLFEIKTRYGSDKPAWQFYRYQRDGAPTLVASMSAEVLVVDKVSYSEQMNNALWEQGMVVHNLKVVDRRNGDELAEMSYVVDLKGRRACGTNTKGAIDVDLFILQAIAAPIVIPELEKQRRARALIKDW